MKKSDLLNLLSKSGAVRIDVGRSVEGDDYWQISLSSPSAAIGGYKSFEECAEKAIEFKKSFEAKRGSRGKRHG
jgi:hypothetical protein